MISFCALKVFETTYITGLIFCIFIVLMLPGSISEKNLNAHYLPANQALLQSTKIETGKSQNLTYVQQTSWPDNSLKLGTVSAVSLDKYGNTVVFHRADRIWTKDSFNNENQFLEKYLGPITDYSIIMFNRKTGNVTNKCGRNLFYMPHGLTIDHEDNIWVTDVALHQVMKLQPNCTSDTPTLVLGSKFVPGQGTKFCKPTSVAVLSNGDFFVADGYCNARILKFSKDGEIILFWGENSFRGEAHETALPNFFAIPHGLTLANDEDLLCVADRENGRVQCFYSLNGTFYNQYYSGIIGDRLFSVDFAPMSGGKLFVVNGPQNGHEVRGYIIDMTSKQVFSTFGPNNNSQFSNPHDIAVSMDGNEVYVAELDPPRIYKFVNQASLFNDTPVTVQTVHSKTISEAINMPNERLSGSTIVYVILLTVCTLSTVSGIFLFILKRWKAGNSEMPLSSDVEYSKLVSKNASDEC